MKNKPLTVSVLICLAFACLPVFADSLVLTMTAEATFDGNPGMIIEEAFTMEGYAPEVEDIGAYPEDGLLRIYGFRLPGQSWDPLGEPAYLVKLGNMNIGDSWIGLPNDVLGPTTSTVEAIESITVAAGTFNNAYKVAMRADVLGPSSAPVEEFWFVEGVGFVLDIGYLANGSIEYTTELQSYAVTGSGFFPSTVGNTWNYTETSGNISAAEDAEIPAQAALLGAYPNPFNPMTRIMFEMAAPGEARIQIFDPAGRLVTTLLNEHREPGRHEVLWNGRDNSGRLAAAGVYLYRLETQGLTTTKRVALVK